VLDRARASGVNITADVYPYTYWQSTLTVLFPERDFENRAAAEFALREVSTPEGLLLSRFDPDPSYVGKTVAEISRLRGTDPATTLMALIRESLAVKGDDEGSESVIGTSMDERDIEKIIAWPYANICSDGELAGRHPRGYGAFTRVLGRYVRERRVLSLEGAVRKMTSLSAANVGIVRRGQIAPGYYADLVLFDPQTVQDMATPTDPRRPSVGIRTVWVNGAVVYDGGATTGRHPGRPIRRSVH
jgi:N-acyl-D-amino-acid deacylase